MRVEKIRPFASAELQDLRRLVSANVQDTLALKAVLSKHVAAITIQPAATGVSSRKGSWALSGKVARTGCTGGRNCTDRPAIDFAIPIAA